MLGGTKGETDSPGRCTRTLFCCWCQNGVCREPLRVSGVSQAHLLMLKCVQIRCSSCCAVRLRTQQKRTAKRSGLFFLRACEDKRAWQAFIKRCPCCARFRLCVWFAGLCLSGDRVVGVLAFSACGQTSGVLQCAFKLAGCATPQ